MRSEHDSYKEPASTQEESTCARELGTCARKEQHKPVT